MNILNLVIVSDPNSETVFLNRFHHGLVSGDRGENTDAIQLNLTDCYQMFDFITFSLEIVNISIFCKLSLFLAVYVLRAPKEMKVIFV